MELAGVALHMFPPKLKKEDPRLPVLAWTISVRAETYRS